MNVDRVTIPILQMKRLKQRGFMTGPRSQDRKSAAGDANSGSVALEALLCITLITLIMQVTMGEGQRIFSSGNNTLQNTVLFHSVLEKNSEMLSNLVCLFLSRKKSMPYKAENYPYLLVYDFSLLFQLCLLFLVSAETKPVDVGHSRRNYELSRGLK